MTNWSNPTLTSLYTDFLSQLKERDDDLALQFDGVTVSNIPTGAIRWNSSVNRWQKWNGSAWAELTSTYALTGLSTTGNASIGGTLSVTGSTTLAAATATTPATGDNSTAVATTAFVRAQGYATLASPALTGTPTAPTAATSTNTTQLATTAFVLGQISNDALLKSGGTVSGALTVTGTTNLGGTVNTGSGVSTGDAAIELGGARSGNGPAYVDFHSQAGTDYEARLLRDGGANGPYALVNNGTGDLSIWQTGAAPIRFLTNNTERMRLTAEGRLGLGRSTADCTLDVLGQTRISTGAKSGSNFYLQLVSTDASNTMELQFGNSTNQAWEIQSVEQNVAYRNLVLNRYGGNVGIGYASPIVALDVNGAIRGVSATQAIRASNGGGTGQTSMSLWREGAPTDQKTWEILHGDQGNFVIRTISDTYSAANDVLSAWRGAGVAVDNVRLSAGGSERLRVTSAGLVGIGTSAPQALLHLSSSTITESFYTATGTGGRTWRIGTGDNTSGLSGALRIYDETGAATRLLINTSGLVGIGTSAPSSILDIKATSNGVDTLIVRPNTTSNFITFKPETASNQFNFGYWTGSAWGTAILNAETFAVAGASEKLRITSAGLVGIGASDPTEILDIRRANGAGNVGVRFVHVGQVEYKIGINDSDDKLYITNNNGDAAIGANTKGIVVLPTGLVGIGTSAPSQALDVVGSVTASASSLAQYFGINAVGTAGGVGNGLFAPAGNTLAFTTGASERLRVTSAGKIGVNTTNPLGRFTVVNTVADGWDNVGLLAYAPGSAQGQRVGITFAPTFQGTADNSPRRAADIIAGYNGGPWTNEYLAFHVGPAAGVVGNDAANLTVERMRLTASGALALGNTGANANVGFRHSKAITGGTTAWAQYIDGTIQTDVTVSAIGIGTSINTAASASLSSLVHYQAATGSLGAGTSITNQIAFSASSSVDGATNDFGFYGNIGAGSGNWNCYMVGAAPNFFNGQVQIGAGSVSAPSVSTNGDTNTGIYFPSADTLAFVEGGSEAARIDDGGRFLRGSSVNYGSHGIQNHSSGLLGSAIASSGWYSGASNCPQFILNRSFSNGIVGDHIVVAEGDRLGDLLFRGSDGTDFRDAARITCAVDAIPASNSVPGRISFHVTASGGTSLTERMRLTNSGQLGIGTTSPTNLLDVNANSIRVRTARTPASSSASGNAGEICWDANYIYVCTATNTWKRAALSTW